MAAPWIPTTLEVRTVTVASEELAPALREDFSGALWNDGGPEPIPEFFTGNAGWGIPIFTP